ncbi:MAG: hypothetical protein ACD_39C00833G0002 [uncultured bacterium]|nr:MAG: hypothetical protein ACD_39C00833G0002 [uncultured bacterium]
MQHLASLPPFFDIGNHRKHDSDIIFLRNPQNGAQLRYKKFRTVKANPDAALTKKRVFFLRNWQIRKRLIAANIKGSDDYRPAFSHFCGNGKVCRVLLIFRRGNRAVHEQEFGTQQPDAFGAKFYGLVSRTNIAKIGNNANLDAICGNRGF